MKISIVHTTTGKFWDFQDWDHFRMAGGFKVVTGYMKDYHNFYFQDAHYLPDKAKRLFDAREKREKKYRDNAAYYTDSYLSRSTIARKKAKECSDNGDAGRAERWSEVHRYNAQRYCWFWANPLNVYPAWGVKQVVKENAVVSAPEKKKTIQSAPETTLSKREKVWLRGKGYCYLCGEKLEKKDFSIDHIHPSSKGGKGGISNLMPAHARCNSDKSSHPLTQVQADRYEQLTGIKLAVHVEVVADLKIHKKGAQSEFNPIPYMTGLCSMKPSFADLVNMK
jgi:5-methylcytosine-specific restriction endonuclease McrA